MPMLRKRRKAGVVKNTVRELVFRTLCRHRQGEKPNILLFCTRRGGSTWILNTMAAHPGMRYVGRPFVTLYISRWRHILPSPSESMSKTDRMNQRIFVHFEGKEEERFRELARSIVTAERHIYPTLNFRASYFNRVTNRVAFQLTSVTAMIEWFDRHLPGATAILLRHPIANALSIMDQDWPPQCESFLTNEWFRDTQLTPQQVDLANEIMRKGPLLKQHVLDWALKMLIPIRAHESNHRERWLVMTYEQAVCTPEIVLNHMSKRLDLPDLEAMRAQMKRPSRTVSAGTVSHVDDPGFLINRWRSKIDENLEAELMQILKAFEIDVYQSGHSMPVKGYLLSPT